MDSRQDQLKKTRKDIKITRKKLGVVVTYLNDHTEEKEKLTPTTIKHIKSLIDLWRKKDEDVNMEFYFSMKEHHSVISGWMNSDEVNKNTELTEMWRDYIRHCLVFRVQLMRLNELLKKK